VARHQELRRWSTSPKRPEKPTQDARVVLHNVGISSLEGDSWMSRYALRRWIGSERIAIFLTANQFVVLEFLYIQYYWSNFFSSIWPIEELLDFFLNLIRANLLAGYSNIPKS
jgi:hypothetical protein